VLAHLARVGRRVLALEHADETDVVHAILDGVERLEEPRQAIALDRHAFLYLHAGGGIGGASGLVDHRRRGRGRRIGRSFRRSFAVR
jgi:hypothetical protein